MWKKVSQLATPLAKRTLKGNIKTYTFPAYKSSIFNNCVPSYQFAKQGKKDKEKVVHLKEREEANVPKIIDLNEVEGKMKTIIENFKVKL